MKKLRHFEGLTIKDLLDFLQRQNKMHFVPDQKQTRRHDRDFIVDVRIFFVYFLTYFSGFHAYLCCLIACKDTLQG